MAADGDKQSLPSHPRRVQELALSEGPLPKYALVARMRAPSQSRNQSPRPPCVSPRLIIARLLDAWRHVHCFRAPVSHGSSASLWAAPGSVPLPLIVCVYGGLCFKAPPFSYATDGEPYPGEPLSTVACLRHGSSELQTSRLGCA